MCKANQPIPLSGALFSVTGVFADGQGHLLNEGQATTLESLDVSALFALHFVQGQTYALEETQAPAGYELISGSLRFVVGADGKVSLDGSGAAPFTGDPTSSAMACLLLAGGLGLVASGLRRRRRRG